MDNYDEVINTVVDNTLGAASTAWGAETQIDRLAAWGMMDRVNWVGGHPDGDGLKAHIAAFNAASLVNAAEAKAALVDESFECDLRVALERALYGEASLQTIMEIDRLWAAAWAIEDLFGDGEFDVGALAVAANWAEKHASKKARNYARRVTPWLKDKDWDLAAVAINSDGEYDNPLRCIRPGHPSPPSAFVATLFIRRIAEEV